MTEYALPGEFWVDFIKGKAERPFVIRQPFSVPLVDEKQLFSILLRAAEEERHSRRRAIQVFLNGGQIQSDYLQLLPQPEDGDLRNFANRVDSDRCLESAMFYMHGCQHYDARLYANVHSFLTPLVKLNGIPQGGVTTDIFCGRYRTTPTGIHRDATSNFSFVVSGLKRYVFWPSETFGGESMNAVRIDSLGSSDFESRLPAGGQVLEARPGDIVYWPVGEWHIAISDDTWAATLNIAMFNQLTIERVLNVLARSLVVGAGTPHPLDAIPRERSFGEYTLSREYEQALTLLNDQTGGHSFRDNVTRRALQQISSLGFDTVPPLNMTESVPSDAVIVGNDQFPIFYARLSTFAIAIAIGGHIAEAAYHPGLVDALDALSTGRSLLVRDFIDRITTNLLDDGAATYDSASALRIVKFIVAAGGALALQTDPKVTLH
jgi:hypothetical protein